MVLTSLFITRLCLECTNNMAEYEAYIMGLEETINQELKSLTFMETQL